MEIIYLILGVLIGAVFTFLVLKNKFASQSGKAEERSRIYEENIKK